MRRLRHSAGYVRTFFSCTSCTSLDLLLLDFADHRILSHSLRTFGFVGLKCIGGSVSQPADFDIGRMFSF